MKIKQSKLYRDSRGHKSTQNLSVSRISRFGPRQSVSTLLITAVVGGIIIAGLAGAYVSTVLPGSIPTTSTTYTFGNPATTDITPSPNPSTVIPYSIVYIPAGAALSGAVANFNPNSITVVIGVNNTVVWKNLDNATHSITSSDLFTSPSLRAFTDWNYTFSTPGTYTYSDPGYSWMSGTITVDAGS